MIQEIIKQNNLECSEEQFNEYMKNALYPTIDVKSSIHSFDELYNGYIIENKTGDINAKYYILDIENGSQIFLQTHVPFIGGFVALTDDNVESEIEKHKNNIIETIQGNYRLQETIKHFKSQA